MLSIEAVNKYYISDGKLLETENTEEFKSIRGPLVYEVNRVMDGVVLFEEGHVKRLKDSLEMLGQEMQYSEDQVGQLMAQLIEANEVENQNIKIVYGNLDDREHKMLLYFVKSHYPDRSVYSKGVKTILFESERENPNAKVVDQSLRDRINEKMAEEGAFEALLVDENGYITEGSRSNFFYIVDGKLYTPPAEKVLLGITRREVIAAAQERGIELEEKPLRAADIDSVDGAFVTGTSIDALPIAQVGDMLLDTANNKIMKSIIEGYSKRVEDYIAKKKTD